MEWAPDCYFFTAIVESEDGVMAVVDHFDYSLVEVH